MARFILAIAFTPPLLSDQNSFLLRMNVMAFGGPRMATPTSPFPSKGASNAPLVSVMVGGDVHAPPYCWTILNDCVDVVESARATELQNSRHRTLAIRVATLYRPTTARL